MHKAMLAIPYIKSPIGENPFLDLPLHERPELVSGCTLVFSMNKVGKPFVLVGQQNSGKSGHPKTNVWDLSGGGLHANEPYVLGATREFSEELGLLPKHTEVLPFNIFKLFEEDGKLKAKVIFIRFFDCYSLANHPEEFVRRCRAVISSLDDRFEYTRLGLLPLDDFFTQLATTDAKHPEMPKADIKFISPWIVPEPSWSPDNGNRWRKSVDRIYNHPLMEGFVRGLISDFMEVRRARNFISDRITPFPVADVPLVDLEKFASSSASNDQFEVLEWQSQSGLHFIAKTLHDKPPREITYTVRNEEISRRCYELVGVNVVPGAIAINAKKNKPYYVMLDVAKTYPSPEAEVKFNTGTTDDKLATMPELFTKSQVIAEMQAGFLVSLLLANSQDIFKNRYWRMNKDGSFNILAGNFSAAFGLDSEHKVSGLVAGITPTQVYLLMTQPSTKTCVNEAFNRLLNHEALQQIENQAKSSSHELIWGILKSALAHKEIVIQLLREFAVKFNDAAITAIVTAAFEKLPVRHTYADEIAWRTKKLHAAIESLESEHAEAQSLVAANSDAKEGKLHKDLPKAQVVVDQYFIRRGLLAMNEYQLNEMQRYQSEQEHMTRTLISRRTSILQFFAKLIPEFDLGDVSPRAARSYPAYVKTMS